MRSENIDFNQPWRRAIHMRRNDFAFQLTAKQRNVRLSKCCKNLKNKHYLQKRMTKTVKIQNTTSNSVNHSFQSYNPNKSKWESAEKAENTAFPRTFHTHARHLDHLRVEWKQRSFLQKEWKLADLSWKQIPCVEVLRRKSPQDIVMQPQFWSQGSFLTCTPTIYLGILFFRPFKTSVL